jgi:hypothetical protein
MWALGIGLWEGFYCLRWQGALEAEGQGVGDVGDDCLDGFMGATDESWEDWEEWMGWEGAGVSDYSSHVNPTYSF